MWSVCNSWNDVLFNGTFEECVKYCEFLHYIIDVRWAGTLVGETGRIVLDGAGCVVLEEKENPLDTTITDVKFELSWEKF